MSNERTEYALEFLGRWYEDKAISGYTEEDAEKITRTALQSLETITDAYDLSPEDKDSFKNDLVNSLSKTGFENSCRNYFATAYYDFEAQIKGEGLEDISPGHIEEYFRKGIELGKTLKTFVEKVREESNIKFPEDLSYSEVDKIFLKVFNSVDNYISWRDKINKAGLQAMSFEVSIGNMTQEAFDFVQVFINQTTELIKPSTRRMFSDLEGANS